MGLGLSLSNQELTFRKKNYDTYSLHVCINNRSKALNIPIRQLNHYDSEN